MHFIKFDEIYKDIKHTLVHYLYTGEYQTLSSKGRHKEYKRSVLAYAAAKKFGFPGLAEHALRYMEFFDHAVNIFQILDIAQEVWGIISNYDDEGQYLHHLTDKMAAALEADRDVFAQECMEYFDYMYSVNGLCEGVLRRDEHSPGS